MSLKYRIAATIFVLEAALLAFVLWQTLTTSRQILGTQLADHESALITLLGEASRGPLITGEYAAIQEYFNGIRALPRITHVLLADDAKRIVASTDTAEIGTRLGELGDAGDRYWHRREIRNQAGGLGLVAIQLSDAPLERAYSAARNLGGAIAVVGMTAIALVGIALGILLTRRLDRLASISQRLGDGDFTARAQLEGNDEIARVGQAFDAMVEALEQSIEQLRRNEERYRSLTDDVLNSSEVGTMILDPEDEVVWVNQALERYLGLPKEELVGQPRKRLVQVHYRNIFESPEAFERATLIRFAQRTYAESFECRVIEGEHREPRWLEHWSQPIETGLFAGGTIDHYYDITQRKEAAHALAASRERIQKLNEGLERRVAERTAQLHETNVELEAFAYTVSHDLRAPLRAMQGFGQALREDFEERLDDTGLDYVSRIVRAAERMDTMIQDLLAYSRLGRAQLRTERVALAPLIHEVLEQLAPEITERQAVVEIEDSLPSVSAHRGTLAQVLTNLITNAIKFVPPGRKAQVRVWAELRGSQTRLWVEDKGIGISPDYHERIFRVFDRLHGIETYPGTGIGLAIVSKGVQRMGGKVGIESRLGEGSRFWVELALGRQEEAA